MAYGITETRLNVGECTVRHVSPLLRVLDEPDTPLNAPLARADDEDDRIRDVRACVREGRGGSAWVHRIREYRARAPPTTLVRSRSLAHCEASC